MNLQGGRVALECSATREQVEDKDDDGQDEQDVDPCAESGHADEPYQPENDKNDGDSPKHVEPLCSLDSDRNPSVRHAVCVAVMW